MSFRTRLMLVMAALAMLASAAIGVFTYTITADRLAHETDMSLQTTMAEFVGPADNRRTGHDAGDEAEDDEHGDTRVILPNQNRQGRRVPPSSGSALDQVTVQVSSGGTTRLTRGAVALPTDVSRGAPATTGELADGAHWRVLTVRASDGSVVTVGRSLAENDRLLAALSTRTLGVVLATMVAAAGAAWLLARTVTARLVRLTGAAEEVAVTGQLNPELPEEGTDETGRLAAAFRRMLSALAQSREDQHRLVQDAGHELRTPLTSLRTNISVLQRHDAQLGTDDRQQLLDDLAAETKELTVLVNELVELATDRRAEEPLQPVDLGALSRKVAARAERRTDRRIEVTADDSVIVGRPSALDRAISNLVDNAAKFDPDGTAPIELVVAGGRIECRDRGPGITPEDAPHLFDRFYRSLASRSTPGSGLGLSIVADVAAQHGGTTFAHPRPGGGAVIGFTVTGAPGDTEPNADLDPTTGPRPDPGN